MAKGDNNNMAARSYSKDFKELLQAVFAQQSYFGDFFGGGLEALDGIQQKDTAFSVKASDVPCVVRTGSLETGGTPAYDTGADVAFGEGTGSTSRFGERTEIIYVDEDVPYTWDWVIHEGIDRHTVNNDFDSAVADRLELQAQKKVANYNAKHGAFISAQAGHTVTKTAEITKDNVGDLFNELHAYYVNIGAVGALKAKVTPEIYAAIVDLVYGEIKQGSLTIQLQNHYDDPFDYIVIEDTKYKVDYTRKLRIKQTFIVSEVQ